MSGFLLAIVAFVSAALSQNFGYTQQGQTRLIGSSFGVLGLNATFDYVIVGGGTSGLTVAKRLAEDASISVAVIEGGGFYEIDNGNISQIPAYDTDYSSASPSDIQPLIDWGIVTTPQTQLDGREILYTQGKCLGGSSGRNYLAYQRGSSGSYQQWADQVGDQSYTFENILPYFKKSLHFTPPNYTKRGNNSSVLYDPTAFNMSGGPLQVSYGNYVQPTSIYIKQAFQSLGLKIIAGFNSGNLLGFSEFTQTVDPQAATRSSSETSFLQEALKTSSLQVYQQTLAQTILIDDENRATGVNVLTAGVPYTLLASKEIILAAGAFRSPQMLLVSGIGPSATLDKMGISVKSDLQGVGSNLWDHPFYGITYRVNMTTNSQLTATPAYAIQASQNYLTTQTGPLGSGGANNWVGWEKLPQPYRSQVSNATLADLSQFAADWPEFELLPIASAISETNDTSNYFSFATAVLTPTSRGNVTINSTDTRDNPVVSPNWLLTTTDQELAVQGFKRLRQIANATGITVGEVFAPGPQVQTDEQILEYIQQTVAPFHHASATCAMGNTTDPNAVVDSKGKVFGIQALRIVDSSVFPLLPPGHAQSTVYMLAEKLADDIKNGD